jgi:phosphate:Na+ symporter
MLIPPDDISHQIANAHTIFNTVNMLLWLPCIWLMVKIVKMIIPGKENSTPKRVVYLDDKLIGQPIVAMNLATKELTRMVDITREMMTYSKMSLINRDIKKAETVSELEDIVDMIERATVRYLSNILSANELTEKQSIRLAGLMHVVSDIERLGDHCKNIAEFAVSLTEKKIPFSEMAEKELRAAFDLMERMTLNSMKALNDGDIEIAKDVLEDEKKIDHLEKDIRKKHMKRLKKHECDPKATLLFVEIIHNLERMGDHCTNIAEAVLQDNNIAVVDDNILI